VGDLRGNGIARGLGWVTSSTTSNDIKSCRKIGLLVKRSDPWDWDWLTSMRSVHSGSRRRRVMRARRMIFDRLCL